MGMTKSFTHYSGEKLLQIGNGFSTIGDAEIVNVYILISSVTVNRDSAIATVTFLSPDRNQEMSSRRVSFNYDLEGENPIKQAYEYIKTLPEFEGAEDC